MTMREKMARAICAADGVDPDATGYGCGITMPKDTSYPLWHARLKQVDGCLDALMDPTSRMAAAGWDVLGHYTEPGPNAPERGFQAMIAAAKAGA